MDDIKRIDLVDIELSGGSLHRSWCKHSIGTADALANAFGVRVFRDGEAVNLEGGTVEGFFRDPQGNNIAISGSSYRHIDDNVAYIILPQACYNYEGQFTLAIKLINSGAGITGTMRIVDGMVDNTNTGSAVAPTGEVPTYEEVLAVYEEMLEAKAGSVRFDITQSMTTAQKTQARGNIDAAGIAQVVRVDASQSLTSTQKTQGRTNIGAASQADLEAEAEARETEDTNLKSAISDLENMLEIWHVEIPVTSGVVVPTSKILDVNIKTGEEFYIRIDYNQTTTSEPPVRAYYSDETSEGLRSVAPNTTYELTAVKDIVGLGIYLNGTYPTGTMILRCYTYNSAVNIDKFVNDVNSEIDSIDQKLSDINVKETQGTLTGETIDSKYINVNGVISDGAGNYHILKIVASAGTKYFITGSTNWGNPFFAYYDAQMNLLQKSAGSTSGSTFETITDFESVAPANTAYLCVNYSGTSTQARVKSSTGYIIAKWSGVKWACVGDSLTDDNQYTEKHYFDYIAEKTGIIPINMGDSGTGYKRGYDSNRAFYQRISGIDTSADIVTIFGSFNDIGAGYDLGTYTDTGTTTIAGCINTTIDNLQTIMPTVVLGIVAPTPWATARPDFHTSADNYVNMLKKIAEHRSIPYLDLFRCSNLRPWDADFRELCYSKDISGGVLSGVHPNELGHKILAPKFEAFLDFLLLH